MDLDIKWITGEKAMGNPMVIWANNLGEKLANGKKENIG